VKALANLSSWGDVDGEINVVVETPKGSRNKFKFEPASGLFELGAPMPAGVEFSFEFGFVPSPLADDGDPPRSPRPRTSPARRSRRSSISSPPTTR